MAQEVESYSFVDWPVQVFAVDYAGDLVALPGRGGVAVLDLSKGISCVGKIIRQSKWDCSAIEWNPHQNYRCQLASTSNQKIELWTWEDGGGKKLQDLRAHTRSVSCLNWSRFDPRLLATCSFDSFIYLWDLRDSRKPKPLSTVSGASHLKWNSADSHVLATTHDGDVRIWDMRKGNMPVHYIAAHLSKINGLDWSPVDGNKLMTCSQDSLVKLWDLGEDTRIPNAVCDHRASVWRAKYTPKAPGNAILTVPLSTASQGTINVPSLWDISNLKSPFQTFYGITSVLEFHWRLSHVDDGYQLLTWSRDQMLKLWNLDPRCWKMTDALKDHKEQSVINSRPSEYLPVSSFGKNGRDNKSSNENMIINLNMKPSKFSEEIAQVCKTVRGVVWEEIDLDNRCCTVSMNIRTNHLKIKIAFPEFYPSVAPSFELIDGSIDSLMKTEITKLLDKEALLCLGNNEFCLEKCLISLILYAEDLMAHDRRLTNSIHPFSPYDAMYSNEMEGAEGRNDYSTPFPPHLWCMFYS
ncbi:GATOR complex protein WDR59-like [Xenia sp. Carnegie-2017]|uniref:GATOR complex protein WDR59-like n=1 Tax=Xenia sp. Carnegie-2017 TaxID=2897299 RepID=UPI001F035BD7|nr:GATOR complex protein WDR59-like [Xenia sp. Carnegie-2017]